MSNDFKDFRCLSHNQCPSEMMCDGGGSCVLASVVYLNNLNTSIEALMYAEACDEVTSNTYSTDGASPSEYVPDWLENHGMCSSKNWYNYSLNVQRAQVCSALSCSSTDCSINSRTCQMSLNSSLWWPHEQAEQNVFAVKPTICDRDYEHMAGEYPNEKVLAEEDHGLQRHLRSVQRKDTCFIHQALQKLQQRRHDTHGKDAVSSHETHRISRKERGRPFQEHYLQL